MAVEERASDDAGMVVDGFCGGVMVLCSGEVCVGEVSGGGWRRK